MNQRDRKILDRFLSAWQSIPQAREVDSLPVAGWRTYSQDMRFFKKASGDLIGSMIFPEDYPPTDNIVAGIETWIEKRKAANWDGTWEPIKYDWGDEVE